jgi:hypothetical protein
MELKYGSENLECYMFIDQYREKHYQIFEKGSNIPVIVCSSKGHLHLSKTIPLLIEDYKYYNEVCDVVKKIIKGEKGIK